jgi:hypothetical protein
MRHNWVFGQLSYSSRRYLERFLDFSVSGKRPIVVSEESGLLRFIGT